MTTTLPPLPTEWEPTRATLHAYARVVGAIPRRHAVAHPRWWHISLRVRPSGFVTAPMAIPGGGSMQIRMDFDAHEVKVESTTGGSTGVPMDDGVTSRHMSEQLVAACRDLGLAGDAAIDMLDDGDERAYDGDTAATLFAVFTDAAHAFEGHRATLEGEVGPVQLWPHGFDLAFEWFGTRIEAHEEDGETTEHPAQINLGFDPGGDTPCFYSNPWPFEADTLLGVRLPHGAEWHTDGWHGSKLDYAALAGDSAGVRKLREYARAVFDAAAPTLMA